MNFKLILFCFILIQSSGDRIYWTDDGRITWNDFQADPPRRSDHSAFAVTGLEITYERVGSKLSFEVKAYFNKKESWKKDSSLSEYLLKHEQLHFDIAELAARRLRKDISNCRFTAKNYKRKYAELKEKGERFFAECQARYDRDSDHSKNDEKQRFWIQKVNKELSELGEYSNPLLSVTLH